MSLPNMDRKIAEPPSEEEIECLVMWPKGTMGETHEKKAIEAYLKLCEKMGFGRMAQIAEQIEDIWRTPKNVAKYQEIKKEHFRLMDWKIK